MKAFCCIVLTAIVCFGCDKPPKPAYTWDPNLELLKEAEHNHPEVDGIANDVKAFYIDLHDKNWEKTYDYRNKVFRQTVSLDTYLKSLNESKGWQLSDFQILNVQILDPRMHVKLICKFVEGQVTSYNDITWEKEDGKWRCDAAGPSDLPMFANIAPYP